MVWWRVELQPRYARPERLRGDLSNVRPLGRQITPNHGILYAYTIHSSNSLCPNP